MLNNLGLGFIFTARDLASGTMRKLGANFGAFSGKAHKDTLRMQAAANMGAASIGLLAVGVGALGAAYAAAKTAGEFEQKLAMVGAISRASAKDMVMLREAAIEAGMVTQFSPHEAAEGLANFASQGFNAQQSAMALTPALDLAAGGMISVAQASSTMSAAVKVFGGGVESAGMKADQLLRIANLTALQANDLEIALGNVARGAIPAKQRIEEMLPAIGLVKNAGVDASVASTSIASALDFMTKNAERFKKEFGVAIADSEGNVRPFLDIVREVDEVGRNLGTAEYLRKLTDTAGRFGKTAFAVIGQQLREGVVDNTGKLLKGAEAIEYLRREMEGAAGAAKEFREKLLNNLPGQMVILQGILQTLAVTLGEPLAKAMKPVVESLSAGVTKIIEVIEGIPGPVKEAMGKALLFFGVLLSAAGVGALWAAMSFLLAGAMKAMAVAAGIAALAIGAIVVAIKIGKALITGYNLAMGKSAERANVFAKAWEKVKLAIKATFALLTGRPISKALADDLRAAENRGVFEFVQGVGRLVIRVRKLIEGIGSGFAFVMEKARPVFEGLMAAFTRLGTALGFIGETFVGVAGSSKDGWATAGFRIGEVIAHILLAFVRATTAIVNGISWLIENFDRIWASVKLGLILFATFRASMIAFKLGVVGLTMALSVLRAIKVAWLWITNAQNLAMLRLNAALIITQLRARGTAIAIGVLRAVQAIWSAIMSGNLIRLAATNAALLLLKIRSIAAAAAQMLLGKAAGAKGLLGSLAGKAGLVAMAAAAGYAFGTWLDKTFQLSDKMADLLADVTGLNDELDELDRRNGGRTNVRGGATFLGPDGKPISQEEMRARTSGASTAIEATKLTAETVVAGQAGFAGDQQAAMVAALKEAGLSSKEIAEAMREMPPPTISVDGQALGGAARTGASASDAREFRQTSIE